MLDFSQSAESATELPWALPVPIMPADRDAVILLSTASLSGIRVVSDSGAVNT
jgi:hypothetical protein